MAQINVAILGAGRIAQSMAETLVKMAADARSGVRGEIWFSGVVRIV